VSPVAEQIFVARPEAAAAIISAAILRMPYVVPQPGITVRREPCDAEQMVAAIL
jgi:hypothetical protein